MRIAPHALVLLIVGVALVATGCAGDEAAAPEVVMVGAVGSVPSEDACQARRLTIQPLDADPLTVTLEQGRPVVAGTCTYGFEVAVPEAERYTFTSPGWPTITLTGEEIGRAEVEGRPVLRVRLDFQQ